MTTSHQIIGTLTDPAGKRISVHMSGAGKRFNRDWIFRHFNYTFEQGQAYAITGPNGSGKSTLLQAIAGNLMLNEGSIAYTNTCEHKTSSIDPEHIYRELSIAAPYLELVEEMTATEFLHFHHQFKPLTSGLSIDGILNTVELGNASRKQIRYYSSGMKQRIKLAQAVFSDAPLLLLDEPCTNLDKAGYALYHHLISTYCRHKLVIVSSNDAAEMEFCTERIPVT
ncbi:MAG TPA: ATP-binding cassette domain-containing protein, partial [Sediminibacterium sp.]